MLLDRAMEYYPYVWNDSQCIDHEVLEAEFRHNFLKEIDYQTFERHRALNLLANTKDESIANDATRPGDTTNVAAGQVDAMPNTVLYAVLVGGDRQYLDTANIPAVC